MKVSIERSAHSFFSRLMQIFWRVVFAIILFVGFLPSNAEITQETLEQEVTVTVKLIQIYVTDKEGNPISDLVQSDFNLYDNGKTGRNARSASSPNPQISFIF